MNPANAEQLARAIRRNSLRMTSRANAAHIGTSLSIADILAVLYTGGLRVDPSQPNWDERDLFIQSKGHGAAALYAVLAECGFFPRSWLETYCQDGSPLFGHVTHHGVPGVEVSTGSLGHGLSIGCGMALAAKHDGRTHRVVVLLSDGECDEGSTWEAALFAPHHHLDNLTAIIDYNKIQSLGNVKEVLDLEPMVDKWRAFGWVVREIDGHNIARIRECLAGLPEPERPSCIVAHTVKGKGVSFMEDRLAWHYKSPKPDELSRALAELGAAE